MADLPAEIEQQIAEMSEAEFDLLIARTRPPEEPANPMERAAAALRRSRGLDRKGRASKEVAAEALRKYAAGNTGRGE